jgi:UDPglucose 6-dehydrogenase
MRIVMVGAGYVGLVSAAAFADFGHDVVCVDHDAERVAALRAGRMPIYEPGLAELVVANVDAGRLVFTTSLREAMLGAGVVFLAVGTPSRRGDGHADLSFVYKATREIAACMDGFLVVVTKSTVPVGTGDEIERQIRELRPDAEFAVVSNPEFLREGAAISDFKRPDRIVIGVEDDRAQARMAEVYRPLYLNAAPILYTQRRNAELIKYAANAFLAMKITFINEVADLCEALGGDVKEVARGIGLDGRIGPKFLHAGPGYGGSCFPKDTAALAKAAQDAASPLRLVETTIAVNDARKRRMARKVIAACGGSVRGSTIAILGLTFKPNTDDLREAPALSVIQALQDAGARVRAYDPHGMEAARGLLDDVEFGTSPYDIAEDADAIVIVTEWDAFRALDFERLRGLMRNPVLVDLRNIYPPAEVMELGFAYSGIGRGDAHAPGGTESAGK